MNAKESPYLIGILLKSDGFKFQNDSWTQNDGVVIGSVVVCSSLSMLCNEFRQLIIAKVAFVPQDFQFISKNGWPIEKSEEGSIEISHLLQSGTVTIQKCFDLPRLGIKWADRNWIGFIFVNFNSYLTEIRVKIHADLGDKLQGSDFEFFTRNECPVSRAQESKLSVWDICNQNFCVLNKLSDRKKLEIFNNQNHRSRKRPSKLNNKALIKKQSLVKNDNPNSILISYVHCEATMHARNLKAELQNMGLDSVFLDIDDIPPGQDWQDVINNALNNCTAFVALVTPRYGETKWTNREAKLADDKEKHIIPVSFLDKWPPDQLAIQFLSLQYIPWKIHDELDIDKDYAFDDISSWDQRCVHRVAKEIKKICMEQEVSTPDSLSLLDSKPMLSNGSLPFYSPTEPRRNKDKVVISAHSTQKQFAEKITTMLKEEGYEVWSSVDFADNCGDFDFLCDDSYSQSPVFDAYCHEKAYSNASVMNKLNHFSCPESKNISPSGRGHEYDNLKNMKFNFRRQVKEASFVIVVMSEDYYKSKICVQQAYYCEQRVDVVVVKYGKFDIDNVFLNFFPEQDMLKITEDQDENTIFDSLKKEIIKILHEGTSRKSYKDQIQALVKELSSELKIDTCVYVIGGTSGASKNAEQFCIHLGAELAKLVNLTLVTEGFFGAGDLVGRNFCEEKEIKAKGQRHSIYHVIPHKDHNINARRARQKDDGSFEKIPYGQTLFYGHSISERDDIVSSTFKICLLIEGGERSACLAEKFLWNDCIVIPVIFNNGAITSKRCLAESLKKVPSGVNPSDWSALNEYSAPDALAKTVKKIVTALLRKVLPKPALTKQSIKVQS